jgi:ABC-type uncharacterized transport system ATPase subunit
LTIEAERLWRLQILLTGGKTEMETENPYCHRRPVVFLDEPTIELNPDYSQCRLVGSSLANAKK